MLNKNLANRKLEKREQVTLDAWIDIDTKEDILQLTAHRELGSQIVEPSELTAKERQFLIQSAKQGMTLQEKAELIKTLTDESLEEMTSEQFKNRSEYNKNTSQLINLFYSKFRQEGENMLRYVKGIN